ncbi:hypothetical protein K491DRAFT_711969 [Lophiostoma macrostomum CBS 122681]|uniref:Heterokaryon incompatibility domain-containing protein n=1 Tax=Lophiostoma macrostomum CBS 122681 TaxID=1314788 RepID=A0A6A6TL66_9PLEO|nr:hypothetical protein K491DRAFT_711969 [Lophiostoma macrostomum CBS 122681]
MSRLEGTSGTLCTNCVKHDWAYHLDFGKINRLYRALENLFAYAGQDGHIENEVYKELELTVTHELKMSCPGRDCAAWANDGSHITTPGSRFPFFRISERSNDSDLFVGDWSTMIILPSVAELTGNVETCSFCGVRAGLIQKAWKESGVNEDEFLHRPLMCLFGSKRFTASKGGPYTITVRSAGLDADMISESMVHLTPISVANRLPRQVLDLNAVSPGLFWKWYRACSKRHKRCRSMTFFTSVDTSESKASLARQAVRSHSSLDARLAPGLKSMNASGNKVISVPETTAYNLPHAGPSQIDTVKIEHMLRIYKDSGQRYSSRKLTKQDDVLNAFSAILGHISFTYSVPSCWGLPTFGFHRNLAWSPVEYTQGRRSGFPTWSWASYIGAVRYSQCSWGYFLPQEEVSHWILAYVDKTILNGSINASWRDSLTTGILRITIPITTMQPPSTINGGPMLDDGTEWTVGERDVLLLGEYSKDQSEIQFCEHNIFCCVMLVKLGTDGIYRRDGLCFVDLKDAEAAYEMAVLKEIRLG